MYTLYATPGACSLNPQILLREAGFEFEMKTVNLYRKTLEDGSSYLEVNPKGYVPALRTPDGQVLTENIAVALYLADRAPEKQLAPAPGSAERIQLIELLSFLATELHKGASPFYNPAINEAFKAALFERLEQRWAYLESALGEQSYLMGERFSVADAYAFYLMRGWQRVHQRALPEGLRAYYDRLAQRPSIVASLQADGLEA